MADNEDSDRGSDAIERDGDVQFVAWMAETQKLELPVLVTVPGALIMGTTISQEKFYAGIGAVYTKSGAPQVGEAVANLGKRDPESPAAEDQEIRDCTVLYLKDGKFITGNSVPGGDGVYIRVRISAISAFALGALK